MTSRPTKPVQDALNNLTTTVYAANSNRVTATVDALNYRTSYVGDLAGQQVARQNALGNFITMTYDLASRQITIAINLPKAQRHRFMMPLRAPFKRSMPTGTPSRIRSITPPSKPVFCITTALA